MNTPLRLDHFTSPQLARWLVGAPRSAALWPVGSVEPHGPHLPLATDTLLSAENAERAARALRAEGIAAAVCPPLPYGVTEFARDFPGAIGIPRKAMVALLVAGAERLLGDGFHHVCFINHHLEPGQLEALKIVRQTLAERHGEHVVSAPQVISRRWGRQLTAEFRSGACHAGQYETSLVLAIQPELVDMAGAEALDPVPISLSTAIGGGATSFLEAGADRAYTGAPAAATAAEGHQTYAVFTEMVVTEVREHLEKAPS